MKLTADNLTSGYMKKPALREVSFALESGQVLCVLGPNGGGKSTLFRTLLGFLPPQSGGVFLDGKPLAGLSPARMAQYLSYIPQAHAPAFRYRALDVVLMGRTCHLSALRCPGKADEELAMQSLRRLDIGYLAQRDYTELSGGERKLVLIARALCQQAQFMVMDEPTSDLDFAKSQLIYDVIQSLAADGYGVLLSTHAPDYPFRPQDKVLLLRRGRTVACGSSSEVLTAENLSAAYDTPMEILQMADSAGRTHRVCAVLGGAP